MHNINQFIGDGGSASLNKALDRMVYILLSSKHIGQPYSEFLNMPIPVILMLMDEYKKELKAEAAAAKKGRKGK